jgi:2,3-diketo-5-methylthio-1-phosphopentane phosphatase
MTFPESFTSQAKILVTDFDGTLTRNDFYDLVCRHFPQIAALHFWQRYEQGEITHFEAMQGIYSQIRATPEEMADLLHEMQLDPKLPETVWRLEQADWAVKVVSAGGEWYILNLLDAAGVVLEVHANPGKFSTTQGLQLQLPEGSPFFSRRFGIDKSMVVRQALAVTSTVAYAGDGRSDLDPALLVSPELRFARGWLAGHLRDLGEAYQPFEQWTEIAERLLTAG